MFSRWLRLLILAILFTPTFVARSASQPANAPYIYYYSDRANAFIVERADGTDAHIFGDGLMKREAGTLPEVSGPGWSPSGRWFAWSLKNIGAYGWGSDRSQSFVVKVDGSRRITLLDGLNNVQMAWSPTHDLLFAVSAYAEPLSQADGYAHVEFYLFDVDSGRPLLTEKKSWYYKDVYPELARPQIQWMSDSQVVVLYEGLPFNEKTDDLQPYRAVFNVDGNSSHAQTELFRTAVPSNYFTPNDEPQPSPDGRYTAFVNDGLIIQDTQTKSWVVLRPAVRSYDASPDGDVIWHSGSQWVIDIRDGLVAGGGPCCPYIGIAKVDGTVRRDLTWVSGELSPITINWLPFTLQTNILSSIPLAPSPRINPVQVLSGDEWAFSLSWSPDGRQLFANTGYVTVWDLSTRARRKAIDFVPQGKQPAWHRSPAGVYVLGLINEDPLKWNGKYLIGRSQDGQYIIALDSNGYGVFDAKTDTLIHAIAEAGLYLTAAVFSPDGQLLAFGGSYEDDVQILNTRDWSRVATIAHPGPGLAFSPDGKQLTVTASWDVEIYNVSDLLRAYP